MSSEPDPKEEQRPVSVTLESSRFGSLEIAEEAVISFPEGLIGLGGSRYALIAAEEDSAFVWLHSIDDPSLAIPVTNPWRFFEHYDVVISDDEAARIGISDPSECDVWVTVRAADALEDFRVNLRAPILVVAGQGHQVINEAEDAPVNQPMFAALHARAA